MAVNALKVKQHAHDLLEQLAPGQLAAVVNLLEVLLREEDEEISDDDRSAIATSREYFRKYPEGGISFEDLISESDFTMDQIRNQGH